MYNINRIDAEHVYLSPVRTDDYAIRCYMEWMSNPEYLHWIGRNHKVCSYKQEKEWAESRNYNTDHLTFNIVLKTEDFEGRLIGNCDIRKDGRMGICIGMESAQNSGYGTEVVKALIDFGFQQLNLPVMYLFVVAENERAIRCYEKAGLKYAGCIRNKCFYDGEYHNLIIMDITKEEYRG